MGQNTDQIPDNGQNSQFSFKNPKTKLLSKGTPLLRTKIDFFERAGQYLFSLSAKNDPLLKGSKNGGTPQVMVNPHTSNQLLMTFKVCRMEDFIDF